jgi:hypothetical protein
MKKLKVELEHCYGIKKLKAEFDFQTNGKVFAIYAPNGVMKTSFANAFRDFSLGNASSDRVWPAKKTMRTIVDENGKELPREAVFVIEPYNQGFRSEKISTLLVNEELRKKYDAIHKGIDEKAEALVAELKPRTGLKDGIREELSDAITHDKKDFYRALGRIKEEVQDEEDTPLGDVVYTDIFNPKVMALLADASFSEKIRTYIEKYDELLNKSTFFKKGVFTHNNAADIAKSLNTNGFFKAEHSVFLRINGEKKEISSLKELESAIQSEKSRILTDDKLVAAFEAIDKQLIKNAELRAFRQCLEQNQIVLPELANPERLKQKLWVAYLVRSRERFNELLDAFNAGKVKIAEIVEEAKKDRTKWVEVISIFNDRFSVPFVVRMDNQVDVILRSDAPALSFDFLEDSNDKNSLIAPLEEGSLMQVLSNGEKRALYILNVIFEVEARKAAKQQTLFVIDDIADSFDYKNKYAIIEYLKEVSDEAQFRQIILSHNFDFYRTVSGRLQLKREGRMFAGKTNEEVFLQTEVYQKSPFAHWKKNLPNDRMLIASIPFLRNLAEFSGDDASFLKLTSLLHVKADTDNITVADLEAQIKKILQDQAALSLKNPGSKVKDLIHQVASQIVGDASDSHALEDKVVLSIAIRLKAEAIMIQKINDAAFWTGITSNQTIELIKRFKADFGAEKEAIQLFEQVNLMTPENIHLNSFMYEPILDLSAQHLKRLYGKLCAMK